MKNIDPAAYMEKAELLNAATRRVEIKQREVRLKT